MLGMSGGFLRFKDTIIYKVVVASIAVTAANYIAERLELSPRPIEQRDVTGFFVTSPDPDHLDKPVRPTVNLTTSNFMFIFREGKLFLVMNTRTNVEEVERYREWAQRPSLVDSNEAYRLATQSLSRVFVDVSKLNRKYKVGVGQASFWSSPPAFWGDKGSNLVKLPLYYVTWSDAGNEGARVGIFGPTKQLMGLTIDDPDLSSRTYLLVTNQKELVEMTNAPLGLGTSNAGLYRLLVPKVPVSDGDNR